MYVTGMRDMLETAQNSRLNNASNLSASVIVVEFFW